MRSAVRAAPVPCLVVTGACSSDPTAPVHTSALAVTVQGGVVAFTQNAVPQGSMEALFEGRVEVDESGCLRLDTQAAHAVIRPVGHGEVKDGGDRVDFDDADRSLAASRCSGRYWIVG